MEVLPSHARSISLPTSSHPIFTSVEEGMGKLRQLQIGTIRPKAEIICSGLFGLCKVYDCVKEALELPLGQQALGHDHLEKKWMDEVMDSSVRLVDLCATTRDILQHMKESAKAIQSTLRTRKVANWETKSKIEAYICSRKKVKKAAKHSIESLKLIGKNHEAVSSAVCENQHMLMLVKVLREVRDITTTIFKSFLSWMVATQSYSKASKWSLVSKIALGVTRNHEDEPEMTEVDSSDQAAFDLLKHQEQESEVAQLKLKAMEECIESLQGGLESLLRSLMQNRVQLLNIFTNW